MKVERITENFAGEVALLTGGGNGIVAAPSSPQDSGVVARFAQNRTLSGLGANVA
jgi:hypothetical protein